MLHVLRMASEKERQAAKEWVRETDHKRLELKQGVTPPRRRRGSWLNAPRPTSIPGLHEAVHLRLDTIEHRLHDAMESRFDEIAVRPSCQTCTGWCEGPLLACPAQGYDQFATHQASMRALEQQFRSATTGSTAQEQAENKVAMLEAELAELRRPGS